ncbi:MAG TPA: type II secretion system protein [Candidatus Acidoferrum sp.]|nr:type II secretion system protein [Candidatus Acidoferrum sp.]
MKQETTRKVSAFTIIEMLVIIAVLMVLAAVLLPSFSRATAKSPRISCLNNLKEIGTGYRLWAEDHGDLVPAQQSVSNGGWGDFLTNANQGSNCWMNYAIMGNEMGQSPRLVVCPADERQAALTYTNGFDNTHVSYFVGVTANGVYPQSIQGGDRNLGGGNKPDPDYGFSPKSGKGNDVTFPLSGPVSWSLKMHSEGNTSGSGNILLGDGSGQQTSSDYLNQTWLRNAQGADNWPVGHVPVAPSIRLVFP